MLDERGKKGGIATAKAPTLPALKLSVSAGGAGPRSLDAPGEIDDAEAATVCFFDEPLAVALAVLICAGFFGLVSDLLLRRRR